MQSLLTSREMPPGERSPPARFHVVIMYEDSGTRKQAKKGLNHVDGEFGSDFEIRHWMWRLDILQDPKLRVRAAPSLAKSDLLMISLRGERRLSATIRTLIDQQLLQTVNHGSALLALFEGATSPNRCPVYVGLSALAEERGLDFFEEAIKEGGDKEEPSLKLVWVF
jgi:hypothetical protein